MTNKTPFFSFLSKVTIAKSHKNKLAQNMLKFEQVRNIMRIGFFFFTVSFLNQNKGKNTNEFTNTRNF